MSKKVVIMDKKQDSWRELFEEVKDMMAKSKWIELKEILDEYHTMDIYDILLELDESARIELFEILPLETAASILEECDADFFIEIVSNLDKNHIKSVFDEMSMGDLSDILRELEVEEREKILDIVSKEDEEELRELLSYVDESSGSTMKKGYVTVNKNLNVAQAIRHIRAEAVDADSIYYIYVLDDQQKLVGVLSLRDLFLSRDSAVVEDIMVENVKSVNDYDDREEAVKLVSKYNLVAIPVTDEDGELKGIITVDDILDVMEEEASEDMYRFAGSTVHERDVAENEKATFKEQVVSCVRSRILWLVLILLLSLLTSYIFTNFGDIKASFVMPLIFFAPVVITIGGSVGSQSAAVTIINLIDKDKDVDMTTILKELVSGVINGIALIIISSILLSLFVGNTPVTIVIGITIFINVILGAMLGTLTPILFKALKSDPSVISSPIISVIMDIIGMGVYYLVINLFI